MDYSATRIKHMVFGEIAVQMRQRGQSWKLPWQKGWFGKKSSRNKIEGAPPMALPKIGLESVSGQASSSVSATSTLAGKSLDYAKARLHIARLTSSEDDVRHGPCENLGKL